MYLLAFVNQVRAAQSRPPLDSLPMSGRGGLEMAMRCSLDGGLMRFNCSDAASDVAAAADLPLGIHRGTVELPHAVNRAVRLMAADDCSPSRQLDGVIGEAGW